jgi:exodeoxyribonuclease VII large subunit
VVKYFQKEKDMQADLFETVQDSSEILTVSQLTREIKGLLETRFPPLWIRGEISNLKVQPSGHRYFILKDSTSQIKSVLFKGDFSHLGYTPLEGDECVAFGSVNVYEPRGDYQFRVKHLMQDGTGGLRLQFDRLKEKLFNEGLFDQERKKELPEFVRRVAIITSIRGAALQDFLSIMQRRGWIGEISIFPCSVQGMKAPTELINAIDSATNHGPFDLAVLTRGGGSIEDLWAFNNEALVRRVASCKIPLISAIGHQTDFVLTDFASDFRAETPTAAAEWITSQNTRKRDQINNLQSRLSEAPRLIMAQLRDKISLLEAQLANHSPQSKMENYHQYLDDFSQRMDRVMEQSITHNIYKVNSLGSRLESNSLKSVLNRGFSYIENLDGNVIDRAEKLKTDDLIKIVFQDGKKNLKVQK